MLSVDSFLLSRGYKYIDLLLSTDGTYDAKDSEWNYSDVPHVDHVHSKFESYVLDLEKDSISSIFLQTVGPFTFPASVYTEHRTSNQHDYVMTIMGMVIQVKTQYRMIGNICNTTTYYRFLYRGFLGFLIALLAKMATRRNYRILMSEDIPMRLQRGKLRHQGFLFKSDCQERIHFTDTLDLSIKNISKPLSGTPNITVSLCYGDTPKPLDELYLILVTTHSDIRILPSVCEHEGASLFSPEFCKVSDQCPWHGKKNSALATLALKDNSRSSFRYLGNVICAHVISFNSEEVLLAFSVQ